VVGGNHYQKRQRSGHKPRRSLKRVPGWKLSRGKVKFGKCHNFKEEDVQKTNSLGLAGLESSVEILGGDHVENIKKEVTMALGSINQDQCQSIKKRPHLFSAAER